jgi:hypothetical protein
MQEVSGSIPLFSTKKNVSLQWGIFLDEYRIEPRSPEGRFDNEEHAQVLAPSM